MKSIARERRKRGLSQERVAELIPCAPGTVARWETGSRRLSADSLAAYARAVRSDRLLREYCERCAVQIALREIEKAVRETTATVSA